MGLGVHGFIVILALLGDLKQYTRINTVNQVTSSDTRRITASQQIDLNSDASISSCDNLG
jgi:hypothetical protein